MYRYWPAAIITTSPIFHEEFHGTTTRLLRQSRFRVLSCPMANTSDSEVLRFKWKICFFQLVPIPSRSKSYPSIVEILWMSSRSTLAVPVPAERRVFCRIACCSRIKRGWTFPQHRPEKQGTRLLQFVRNSIGYTSFCW